MCVNVKKARHNCLCLITVRSHHAVWNDLTLLLLPKSTCKDESFAFRHDVALPQELRAPSSASQAAVLTQEHLSIGTSALQLHFTRTSRLKVDVVLHVLQKIVLKQTLRENRTVQKTRTAPNRSKLFK